MRYSVTTVCLPELTLKDQTELLARLGYDGMELRVRRVSEEARKAPPSCWGRHVNDLTPENFKEKAGEICAVLNDHGLQLAGIASALSCADLEQFESSSWTGRSPLGRHSSA